MGLTQKQYERRKKRQARPYEADWCKNLVSWVRGSGLPGANLFYHIRNEYRHKPTPGEVARDILEGMVPGYPDYCLPVPLHGWPSLIIECKRDEKEKTKEHQDEIIQDLRRVGNLVVVCYSFDEGKKTILNYYEGTLSE